SHGSPFLRGRKARGAPCRLQARRASIVLRPTLRRRGRCVLLTTTLLIEEPEGQHDQRDDQADLENEEKEGKQEHRCQLPEADADDAYGRQREDRLHLRIRV